MGRRVDQVLISNWQATGGSVPVDQYTVEVEVHWRTDDQQKHEHSDTYTFPNVLGGVPLARLRRYMEAIIMHEVRIQLGIDEDE